MMLPGQEIPQRIKIVNGWFAPEFPGECEPHTPESPKGYLAYFEWCEEISKTHNQRQCHGCGLWAIWEPKPGVIETVHACPPDGSNATPCCNRSPFELPRTDRITEDPALATCEAARPQT